MVGAATAHASLEERTRAKRAALARHPLFAGCPPVTVRRFAAFADEVHVAPGDVVVEQGRHGLWFFMIDAGEAEVLRDGIRTEVLAAGQHFGEAAVLRQVLQPATVRALSDMTLYVIGCQRLVPMVRDTRALRVRLGNVAHAPRAVKVGPPRRWSPCRPIADRELPCRPVPRQRTRRWLALGALAAGVGLAAAWHPPVAVVAPGRPFDVTRDISIVGAPATPVHGRYLAPTVRITHPTLLGLGVAMVRRHRHVVGAREVYPPGTTAESRRRNGAAAFRRSQLVGAAAGARAAGVDPRNISVHFRDRAVTGPSAGLAYALAIEDMLNPVDVARGRTIVATGDVLPDGSVGAVGFVGQKASAAVAARAAILLVPDVEITEAWGNGLRVEGVGSVADAVSRLTSRPVTP